jgi:hypothetical protein
MISHNVTTVLDTSFPRKIDHPLQITLGLCFSKGKRSFLSVSDVFLDLVTSEIGGKVLADAEAGVRKVDLALDSPNYAIPTTEAACLAATLVPHCDYPGLVTSVLAAEDASALTRVEVKAGKCSVSKSPSKIATYNVFGTMLEAGEVCDLLVFQKDGNQ